MRAIAISVPEKKLKLGDEIFYAESFFDRLKGLMFSDKVIGDGLLISRCNSIQTFFMKYDIDVVFLDRKLKVIKVIRNLKPWRMTLPVFFASQTLELMGGTLSQSVAVGDQLEVRDV